MTHGVLGASPARGTNACAAAAVQDMTVGDPVARLANLSHVQRTWISPKWAEEAAVGELNYWCATRADRTLGCNASWY